MKLQANSIYAIPKLFRNQQPVLSKFFPSPKRPGLETMASKVLLTLLLLVPMAFVSIKAGDLSSIADKEIDVVVESMVYCQSCKHFGSWCLDGAKPIPGAKVSVTCKNHKSQISYYKVFEADKNGYLYAPLKGFKMGHSILDHPLHSCFVKLVWSPLETCGLLSNVNYALNGAPLRFKNKVLQGRKYKAIVYTAGPLAFRPSNCPATHV